MLRRTFFVNFFIFLGCICYGLFRFLSFFTKKYEEVVKISLDTLNEGVNEFPEYTIIVIKHRYKFLVLDATCTHLGCNVKFIPKKKYFQCPCHRSIFSLSGKVIKGPAKKNLKKLNFKVSKRDLIIVKTYT